MSAISPCCQAEEEEKCHGTGAAIRKNPTKAQLEKHRKKCKRYTVSADSSTSNSDEFTIEGYAPAGNHRPQNVGSFNWAKFPQDRQTKINQKTGTYILLHSTV